MDSSNASNPPVATVSTMSIPVWRAVLLDRLTCAMAAILALAGYLATMPPGVTGEDSGELIAAAWVLGIPHPPGYPLWCVLAYPILHLADIGSIAWRGNLASALFGAAGVWLVAETVLAIFGRRLAAFAAAAALAFSREYWQQAIIAEVYTLGAMLVAAHLLCMARWVRSHDQRTLYAAGFFAGLAGAHYSLNLVFIPMLGVLYFLSDLRPRRWRRYGWLALWSVSGALIYLYLPVRSLADPAMDWGNPETWPGFVDVVLRRQYADLVSNGTLGSGSLQHDLSVSVLQLVIDFSPWVTAASVAGILLWPIDKERRAVSGGIALPLYFLCTTLLLAAATVLAPEYPAEYQWDWLRTAYWLPVAVLMSVGIGALLAWLAQTRFWIYGAVCAVCALSPLLFNAGSNDRRDDRIAENYGTALLEGMQPDAVYFGGGDHTVFPAVYLHIVEGRRPDVLIADRYGYAAPDVYALVGETPSATRPSEAEEQRLFDAVLAKTNRPVYSAIPRLAPGYTRVNEGLLYRYLRESEAQPETGLVDVPAEAFDTRGEWSNELITHEYLAARGRGLFDSGDPVGALAALSQAADYVHGDKHALNNLGLNAAEGGQVEAGAVYFRRALNSDPLFLPAALNLAKCYLLQGTPDKALEIIQRFDDAGLTDPGLDETKRAALAAQEAAAAR